MRGLFSLGDGEALALGLLDCGGGGGDGWLCLAARARYEGLAGEIIFVGPVWRCRPHYHASAACGLENMPLRLESRIVCQAGLSLPGDRCRMVPVSG